MTAMYVLFQCTTNYKIVNNGGTNDWTQLEKDVPPLEKVVITFAQHQI